MLLNEGGEPKLADFGLVRFLNDADDRSLTQDVGSEGYRAPEQSLGLQLSPRTDLYSLGVIIFEVLSGQRPAALAEGGSLLGRPPEIRAPIRRATLVLFDIERPPSVQENDSIRPSNVKNLTEAFQGLLEAMVSRCGKKTVSL